MKKLFTLILFLVFVNLFAQCPAESPRSQVIADINSKINANGAQAITGAKLNCVLLEIANSALMLQTDPYVPSFSLTTNYIPYYNGSTLANSNLSISGNNINQSSGTFSIGTSGTSTGGLKMYNAGNSFYQGWQPNGSATGSYQLTMPPGYPGQTGSIFVGTNGGFTSWIVPGATGTVLTSTGISSNPSWQAVPSPISGLTTNYFPIATGATAIGNSNFYQTSDQIIDNTSSNYIDYNSTLFGGSGMQINSGVTWVNIPTALELGLATGGQYGLMLFNDGADNHTTKFDLPNGTPSAITYHLPSTIATAGQSLTAGAPSGGISQLSWSTPSTSGTAWQLLGNSGLTDGTNFIGNTDNIPFTIRTNNIASARIDPLLHNSFYGYKTPGTSPTGKANNSMGYQSMYSLTGGSGNVACGDSSLFSLTSGSYNIGIGYQAADATTTGTDNTAMGYNALLANTTGGDNVAIGQFACAAMTTTSDMIGIGYNALGSFTNANHHYEVAMGLNAIGTVTNGIYDVGIGYQALGQVNGTIGRDVAVGGQALEWYNSGTYCTALGYQALYGSTNGGGGSNNTAVGAASGVTLGNGSNNTFVGAGADVSSATLSNATAIGSNAQVSASNTLVLGSNGTLGTAIAHTQFTGALEPYYSAAYNPGTSGQVLTSQGSGVSPQWANASSISGLTKNYLSTALTSSSLKNSSIYQCSGIRDSNCFYGPVAPLYSIGSSIDSEATFTISQNGNFGTIIEVSNNDTVDSQARCGFFAHSYVNPHGTCVDGYVSMQQLGYKFTENQPSYTNLNNLSFVGSGGGSAGLLIYADGGNPITFGNRSVENYPLLTITPGSTGSSGNVVVRNQIAATTGLIGATMLGSDVFCVHKSVNADQVSQISNDFTGSAASSSFYVTADVKGAYVQAMSSTHSGTGVYSANHTCFVGDGTMCLDADDAAGVMQFYTGGSASSNLRATLDAHGNFIFNSSGSVLPTSATNGFTYIPNCAGTPSGTPAFQHQGATPMVYDSVGQVLYAYTAGAWNPVGGTNANSAQTTVSGSTSGTVIFSEPIFGASYKKVTIYFLGPMTGTASYTFPVAFVNQPGIIVSAGVIGGSSVVTALSTTAVTVTGASDLGYVTLEGY